MSLVRTGTNAENNSGMYHFFKEIENRQALAMTFKRSRADEGEEEEDDGDGQEGDGNDDDGNDDGGDEDE